MRHQNVRSRLKQKPGHARMLKRNLVTSMFLYEEIRTTRQRAKVIQPYIDRIVQYAKKHPPHVAIRYINSFVTDKNASRKVMEVFIKRYEKRDSGLTRMVAVGARKGDGASLVDLSFVDRDIAVAAPEKKKTTPKKTLPSKSGSTTKAKA